MPGRKEGSKKDLGSERGVVKGKKLGREKPDWTDVNKEKKEPPLHRRVGTPVGPV